jgi:hypothetical protein
MKLSASAGLAAAETKQCADKLLLKVERDGFVSL